MQAWFPDRGSEIVETFKNEELGAIQRSLFDSGSATYSADELKDEDRNFAWNAAVRRNVVKLYEQRCTFRKMWVVSWDGRNIVDRAHIMPSGQCADQGAL